MRHTIVDGYGERGTNGKNKNKLGKKMKQNGKTARALRVTLYA